MPSATIPAALTTAAAIGGVTSAAVAVDGMMKGSPKAPAPVATPAAPTINMARQAAGTQAGAPMGALANMLTPNNNTAALSQPNSSLKQLLGQ